jgi:hypothetical protein
MNASKEDKLGMFVKCQLYLSSNAATLAINPFFATTVTSIDANITAIVDADSTATRNLTGFTTSKGNSRSDAETSILTIGAACRGYYTTHADTAKKMLATFTKTDVLSSRDADLLVIADRVLDIALPIKALLAPWGVTAVMVTDLNTKINAFRDWLQKPRSEQINSQVAGTTVDTLFNTTDALLASCDDQMAVFEYTNAPLYLGWQLSRAIDDSGGGSDSAGFAVQNYTVPANGFINFFTGTLDPAKKLYLRVIGGNGIIVCTADSPASPCTPGSGFTAQPETTYKDSLLQMSLDTSKPNMQFTNNGTINVVVRAGFES